MVPDQLRVEELPKGIEEGEAEKRRVGAGADEPPPPAEIRDTSPPRL